jgi:hypothetical protein
VLCPEDFHGRSVVALNEHEGLSGNSPLQAASNVADALALGCAPSGTGAGLWVAAEPGHHRGVGARLGL